jgi:hypothetical protein
MKTTLTIGRASKMVQALRLLDGTLKQSAGQSVKMTPRGKYWMGRNLSRLATAVDDAVKPFMELREKYTNDNGDVLSREQTEELNRLEAEIIGREVEIELTPVGISEIQEIGTSPGLIAAIGELDGAVITET